MHLFLQVLWFLLPSAAANLIPPIAAKLFPQWDFPVDFGFGIYGKRIFGAHKTFRGLAAGVLVSTLTLKAQCFVSGQCLFFQGLEIDSIFCDIWFIGPLLGGAALAGDLVKSFIKRRFDFKPGDQWIPWDQMDWILGVVILTYPIFKFNLMFSFSSLILGAVLSFSAKIIGYWLGINSHWI